MIYWAFTITLALLAFLAGGLAGALLMSRTWQKTFDECEAIRKDAERTRDSILGEAARKAAKGR